MESHHPFTDWHTTKKRLWLPLRRLCQRSLQINGAYGSQLDQMRGNQLVVFSKMGQMYTFDPGRSYSHIYVHIGL